MPPTGQRCFTLNMIEESHIASHASLVLIEIGCVFYFSMNIHQLSKVGRTTVYNKLEEEGN